ncbi:CxC2 domain-containing protein [Mycena sanguinolenta]|uniref:CxC2 domain-containing protein n=1 Tax=Mycena sanguinolenta TaxID=230812 RepID=A0A8H6ZIK5_9AGAR|nr:CxC2 domain-containing protein [Mycena sanguinolenta]
MSTGRKRKAVGELLNAAPNYVPFRNPKLKRVHYTITDSVGSTTSSTVVSRVPVPVATYNVPVQRGSRPESNDVKITPSCNEKKRTQNGELLDDFGDHFDELGKLLLDAEADEETALMCACGSGMKRNTKCYDCIEYPAACKDCFVQAHLHNPFHWAEVWDDESGFFVRHDISKLGHVIQLGHNGMACKSPVGVRLVTVVHGNGVHSTRLSFCGCREMPPYKIRQLMHARLFPATTKDPHTMFTISMLKEFQLHNLEYKKAAYDYLGALRRLSDNSFTADIPNPYSAFLRVDSSTELIQYFATGLPAIFWSGARHVQSLGSTLIQIAQGHPLI